MGNPYQATNGHGLLEDYSNLGFAGEAFKGFAQGMERAEDNRMKRQEQEARIASDKAKMEREAFEHSLSQRKQKAILDASAHNQAPEFNDAGEVTGTHYKPEYLDMEAKKAAAAKAGREATADYKHDAIDRREHERVLTRIASNPVIKQKLNQFQGLDNSLSIITQSDHITPEQIHEFQQAIRGNMGMKGSSGVGEREETYFKSAGLNAARWKEFLTGDPASIAKDSNLIAHFRQLAAIEQGNIKQQFQKALDAGSGGHASMYARRPDLYQDLLDAQRAQAAQMESPPQEPPPPQGMLNGKRGGFLSGMIGNIFGSQADAAPRDPDAEKYAQMHGLDYQTAAKIVSDRKAKMNGK